ncbi:MAG: hypothetical protein KF778_15500 [Rhodocyclaceae bacterium]|nr:hypothetical protein [Rhodocyclaceae bacterium]MBX3669806.1 hypothetical protein [Rhodocyclaceae bacterium]
MPDTSTPPPADQLAGAAPTDTQKLAARMAQDAFARLFRLTAGADDQGARAAVQEAVPLMSNWARAGQGEAAQGLRLAMLVAGLDQWGLAYSQAFGLVAIPALTELLGALRTDLDARADAWFQRQYAALAESESAAIDFKVESRRAIHLALYHAMIAAEQEADALRILAHLGGMLVAQAQSMPHYGWRIVADALLHVQIACLDQNAATGALARDSTQQLFDALAQALPKPQWDAINAYSAHALREWQMSRRGAH